MRNKANFRQSGRKGKCFVEKELWYIIQATGFGETKPIPGRAGFRQTKPIAGGWPAGVLRPPGRASRVGLRGALGLYLPGAADRAIIFPAHVHHRGQV